MQKEIMTTVRKLLLMRAVTLCQEGGWNTLQTEKKAQSENF